LSIKSVKHFLLILTVIISNIACKKGNGVNPGTLESEKCLLEKVEYYANGVKINNFYQKYVYNEKKQRIKGISVYSDCPNEDCYFTNEYDSNNNLVKSISYDHNVKSSSQTFNYDSKGNQIKQALFNSNDKEIWGWSKEFNLQGKTTRWNFYDNQNLSYFITYEYDSKLNLLVKNYSTGEELEKYTYDSQNNLIETKKYKKDLLVLTTSYKYDSKNRIIGKIENDNNRQVIVVSESFYNDNQNIVTTTSSTVFNGQKLEWVNIYYYDINKKLTKEEYFNEEKKLEYIKTKRDNPDGFIIFDEVNYILKNFKNHIENSYICN